MNEATAWAIAAISGAIAIVGLVFGVGWSINNTATQHTNQIAACAEAGGTWISTQNASHCVGDGKGADR